MTAAQRPRAAVNRIADENVRLRTEADAEIARQVGAVNDALHAIDDINSKIATLAPKGVDVTGLQDERGRMIDGIASIVPVRVVKRDGDQVALYSAERRRAARRPGLRARLHAGAERRDAGHDARRAGSAG